MKKVLFLSVIIFLFGYSFFLFSEANVVLAAFDSVSTTTISLTVTDELSLSCPVSSPSLGSIAGMTGGTVSVDVDCNVKTNNRNGYTLTLTPTSSPALVSTATTSNYFTNFAATSTPDHYWSLAANEAKFGFSVTSTDAVSAFKYGTYCGDGSNAAMLEQCFRGFDGITPVQIASRSSETLVAGTTTTVQYKAGVGASKNQPSGTYQATITVTAATL